MAHGTISAVHSNVSKDENKEDGMSEDTWTVSRAMADLIWWHHEPRKLRRVVSVTSDDKNARQGNVEAEECFVGMAPIDLS